jgi:DNA polymerase-1
MGRHWIIVDSNSIAWRAHYSVGNLKFKGQPTGVLYGFLATIIQLEEQLGSSRFVFAFDLGKSSKRRELCREYKRNRFDRKMTSAEKKRRQQVYQQIALLRKVYLKQIGFNNIFSQVGYEADDIIASVCKLSLGSDDRATVVSGDHDLYQLLERNVNLWNPTSRTLWSKTIFANYYGILPRRWSLVKAMSGCASDDVKGIQGIGERTAIKFLNSTLPEHTASYKKISSIFGERVIKQNLRLVRLPFKGTQRFKLKLDGPKEWKFVLHELGIRTLTPELEYRELDLYSAKERKRRAMEAMI